MPSAEFFNKFGIFSEKDFLEREFCEILCREMSESKQRPSSFVDPDKYELMNDDTFTKRSEVIDLPKPSYDKLGKMLLSKIPQLEEHFGVNLKGIEPIVPAIYRKGDFINPHTDNPPKPGTPQYMQDRKVAMIVFLNEESEDGREGTYCGGNLTFYGLIEEGPFGNMGMPLLGEAGMFIAFPPDRTHQVTEVTAGERFVLVSFYK